MRLFVFIGGLIVLVLLAALIGPYFVDWGNYRDRFEAEASRILGQDVRVAGDASARLLPFPSVTFTDVRVGPEGANTITVEEFSMDAELAPFLRGEILIFDMNFVSPVVRLDLDEDGTPIWAFPSHTPFDPAQIILENASFSDGTLVLRDRIHARQWNFTGLTGTAAADSLYGPWRVEGDGLIRGAPFSARVSTGSLNRNGFAARVVASLPDTDIEFTTEGRIAPPQGDISSWYAGTFRLRPTDEGTNYLFEGLFEADANALTVEQFRGDFGDVEDPYIINGSASIIGGENPSFTFSAKGNQLNVAGNESESEALPFAERFAGIEELVSRLPFPPMPGTIDLDLPALIAGSTTIRDVRIIAEPQSINSADAWNITRFEAQLPGRSVVEGGGTLALMDKASSGPRFVGEVLLASRQPSGLANWLSDDVSETIRLLPNAGVSAQADISATQQAFKEMEIILGEARLGGAIIRSSAPDILPNISLNLTGDNPDFDTLNALSDVVLGTDGRFRAAGHDIDMALAFTNADIAQMTIGKVDAQLRMRGERTEIDRLSIEDLYGGTISATGKLVREVQGDAFRHAASWDAAIFAPDGAAFIEGLGTAAGANVLLNSLVEASKRSSNSFDGIELNSVGSAIIPSNGDGEASASISGSVGGSAISITSTLAGALTSPSTIAGSLTGTIENAETATLLSQAGLQVFPVRLLGEGKARVSLSGSLDDGLSASLALDTEDTNAKTDGVFRRDVNGLRYTGSGSVSSGDIEPWLDLFGYIFPSTGLGTALETQGQFGFTDRTYTFTDVEGAIGGNAFAGSVELNAGADAAKINGVLNIDEIDPLFLASILSGRYNLNDKDAAFAQALYADHALDLDIEARRIGAGNASMENARLRLIYRDGGLSIDGFEAALGEGRMRGSVDVQNNEGSIFMDGQLNTENTKAAQLLTTALPNVDAGVDLNLSFSGNGKTINAFIGSLTGAGVIAVSPFDMAGINVDAMTGILQRADEIGYEITDAQIADIANDETRSGAFRIPELTQPLSITSGVARVSNVSIADHDAVLDGDLSYDLATRSLSGEARVTFDARNEGIVGTLPEIQIEFDQLPQTNALDARYDYALLTSFVRQRALQREQARVEALQARLLEKQRLRRQVRYLRYEAQERARLAELERIRLAEEERQRVLELERLEAERLAEEQRLAAEAAAEQERAAESERQRRLQQQPVKPLVQPRAPQQAEPAPATPAPSIFQNIEGQLGFGN